MSVVTSGCTLRSKMTFKCKWTVPSFSSERLEVGLKSHNFAIPTDPETHWYFKVRKSIHYELLVCTHKGKLCDLCVNCVITGMDSKGLNRVSGNESKLCLDESHHIQYLKIGLDCMKPCKGVYEILCTLKLEYSTSSQGKAHIANNNDHTNLSSDLRELYLSEKLCDITLLVGDDQIKAHKSILCARSAVFTSMFEHEWKENSTNILVIEDLSETTVRSMLHYIYSGELTLNLGEEDYLDLYYAAHKYDVIMLKVKCANYLIKHLNVYNVCEVYICSHLHNDNTLKEAVLQYITRNVSVVLSSKGWDKMLDKNGRLASEVLREVSNRTRKLTGEAQK